MRVALDSNIFIYALGRDETWSDDAIGLFRAIEHGTHTGVASVMCLTEVLAYPYRFSLQKGEEAQLFMEGLEGLDYIPTDLEIAIRAGRLRGEWGATLTTPGAIHLATAQYARAEVLVTNDRALLKMKLPALRIHPLGEPI